MYVVYPHAIADWLIVTDTNKVLLPEKQNLSRATFPHRPLKIKDNTQAWNASYAGNHNL